MIPILFVGMGVMGILLLSMFLPDTQRLTSTAHSQKIAGECW